MSIWRAFRSKAVDPVTADDFTAQLVQPSHAQPEEQPRHFEDAHFHVRLLEGGDETGEQAPKRIRTIACMVTHGMGQQVPYATLGELAESFVKGRKPHTVQANRVSLAKGADLISRMELVYLADKALPETHVHIYEGYWAPLTEGKIGFFATILFLLSGAWEGIKSALRPIRGREQFERWIFGKLYNLPIKPGTVFYLLGTLLVLGGALGLFYLCESELRETYAAWSKLPSGTLLSHLRSSFDGHMHLLGVDFKSAHFLIFFRDLIYWFAIPIVFTLSAVYVFFIRYAVIEYVGDVAIYVSAYKVSAYEEVRKAIQKVVFEVGCQIFQAKKETAEEDSFLYDEVFFVGHSLGSVITYDLLDALIVWDVFGEKKKFNVAGRTSRLITFGSPLDKTAFLFRTQISPEHRYREALAALQQPLVLDYRLRPFQWVNLYSPCDVVSGKLAYYDVPEHPKPTLPGYASAKRVLNKRDPYAWIPLIAHVQYWNGDTLAGLLQDVLLGRPTE